MRNKKEKKDTDNRHKKRQGETDNNDMTGQYMLDRLVMASCGIPRIE